jgi:hypothetical protein
MHRQIIRVQSLVSALRGQAISGDAILAYMDELSTGAPVPIIWAALFFKHKAYRNEEEYRFFQLHQAGPVPNLKYRGRPYSLVRYKEFDWRSVAPDAIRKIVIGPAADRKLASQFAHDCLRAFHPATGVVNITCSEIPYRAL